MRTLSTQSDAQAVCWYCLIYSGQTCCRFNKYCGCLLNFCRGPYPSNQASRQPTRDLGRTKKRTIASVEYCINNFVVTCVLLHCTSLMMTHGHLSTLALSQAPSRVPTTLRKPIMRLHSTQMSAFLISILAEDIHHWTYHQTTVVTVRMPAMVLKPSLCFVCQV